MKFVDEFREPGADQQNRGRNPPARRSHPPLPPDGSCGGHTHAIYRFGLKDILPANIELIHGPGCPVCVLPMGRIDDGLVDGRSDPNVIFAAFGDMMRVPARTAARSSTKRAAWMCASSIRRRTRIKLAQANPDKHVMFFAIGFETTAPSTALTLHARENS